MANTSKVYNNDGDNLVVASGGTLDIESGGALEIGGVAITAGAAELNVLDNVTAGTAAASKAVVLDSAKNVSGVKMTDSLHVFAIGAHDYAGAAVDWTLSAAELLKTVHKPTNANGPVNAIIAAAAGIPYVFVNGSGQNLVVKTPAGTGPTIANGKALIVMSDGTNVIALAAASA
jgi:hypothetical protein